MSKVSVVIPSYNHDQYIRQAVDSVLNQTHRDLELIVIDDGSKDSSWDYLSRISDSRVTALRQENQGAHNTINRGLSMATGEFLAILNSDDAYMPHRLEQMLEVFAADPSLDCLCSYIEIIDSAGKAIGVKEGWHNCEPWPIAHPEKSYKMLPDFNRNLLMTNFVATTSNIIFRRKAFNDVGGMRNLRFAHDWDFLLRMAGSGHKCDILKEPLMRYRIHGTNTINTNRKWLLFEVCLVVATNLDWFYARDIFTVTGSSDLMEQISLLGYSMNFQGNDKVFWMIRTFLEALRTQGVEHPEEKLMENPEIRQRFIDHIEDSAGETETNTAAAQQSPPQLTWRKKAGAIKKILMG